MIRRTSEDRITPTRPDSPVSRTPELLILLLAALLAAGAIALGTSGGGMSGDASETVSRAHVALVARRVEVLRGLRFRHPVRVEIVSPAQARRVGTAEAERSQPLARRRASEELLKLLGLLPASADLGEIEADVFEEQVAGYYDPRRGRLALVRGAGVDDVTLAHELTHALEDQHADLERLGGRADGDDARTARQALVEGTATLVMERYARRWPSEAPVGDALAGLTQVAGARPLPQYVARSLVFPYFQGLVFVRALVGADRGGWDLVDVAERARPPRSTAEILDADRWLRAEQPVPVSLAAAELVLRASGDGWRRAIGSTLGAEDLAALLSPTSGPLAARSVTTAWRGGRYALWRRGPLNAAGCTVPCRARDTALLAVRMSSVSSSRLLARALRRWSTGLPAGATAAVAVHGTTVRVALAPDRALATRLTR